MFYIFLSSAQGEKVGVKKKISILIKISKKINLTTIYYNLLQDWIQLDLIESLTSVNWKFIEKC